MAVTDTGIKYLDDKRSSGTVFGQDATSNTKLGFYGATPVVQPASGSQAAVTKTTTTTVTSAALSTDITNILTLLNQLRAELVELGIVKGAA